MYSKPETIKVFSIIPCWAWAFVLIPMFMPFIGLGLWEQAEKSVWLEIGYHVVNGIIMLLIMLSYLQDDWFMVTTDVRFYLKHVALTVGLIAVVEVALLYVLYLYGFSIEYLLNFFPVVEMSVCQTPLLVIDLQPIFGTIALSLFTPISICVLLYCLGFAPICNNKPWLAYLCIAVITLIPPVIDIIWRGEEFFMISGYFVRLPIHLLACWSYQKTDNVWTPIATLAVTNLLSSIALSIIMSM